MAAGSTYTPLATTTTASSAASVTFSSISGAYTDLVIVSNGGSSTSTDLHIQFNGDTATNYSRTVLSGSGTAATSTRQSSVAYYRASAQGYLNTSFPNFVGLINIMNYSNTTTYKTALSRTNNAGTGLDASVGLWRNTAAITSITLFTDVGTFTNGSTFTLYGIASA
jgi:hypothetical protein